MNLNKGISTPIAILIIVICAALAGGIVWQYKERKEAEAPEEETPPLGEQEEEEETANWKVYRNEEYGFEVKHPLGWELTEDFSKKGIGGPVSSPPGEQYSPIFVIINKEFEESYIQENYPDFPWPDAAGCTMQIVTSAGVDKDFNQSFEEACQDAWKTKDVVVDGESAIRCEFATGPAQWEAVWLLRDNKGIAFVFSSLSPIDCERTFNKILSTFKFID